MNPYSLKLERSMPPSAALEEESSFDEKLGVNESSKREKLRTRIQPPCVSVGESQVAA